MFLGQVLHKEFKVSILMKPINELGWRYNSRERKRNTNSPTSHEVLGLGIFMPLAHNNFDYSIRAAIIALKTPVFEIQKHRNGLTGNSEGN